MDKQEEELMMKIPKSYTGGKIGNFYPQNKINALMRGDQPTTHDNQRNEEYRDLLKRLVKNKS